MRFACILFDVVNALARSWFTSILFDVRSVLARRWLQFASLKCLRVWRWLRGRPVANGRFRRPPLCPVRAAPRAPQPHQCLVTRTALRRHRCRPRCQRHLALTSSYVHVATRWLLDPPCQSVRPGRPQAHSLRIVALTTTRPSPAAGKPTPL